VLDWLSSGSADFSISIKENLIQGFHYDVIGIEIEKSALPDDSQSNTS
jgi:hypothetical protein